jgi:predicted histidine transporter YuiF (NhaC family)
MLHYLTLSPIGIEVYFILILLGIPVYLLFKKIFTKQIEKKSKLNLAIWASTLIFTPIIYVGIVLFIIYIYTREPARSFNQAKWAQNKEARFEMGDDIVKSDLLINLDSIQVKFILGEPNWRYDSTQTWTYEMGWGGGFGFLLHQLSVTFKNNKVEKVRHDRNDI